MKFIRVLKRALGEDNKAQTIADYEKRILDIAKQRNDLGTEARVITKKLEELKKK